ncbi:hypothetical protein Tco_0903799, partial [Tanacetum coccineum]
FGVAERLSHTFRAESTRLRAEAPKMLWADSVSTTYLIYRISYVPIGLRILEEEWRGKDTSLAHLKLLGYEESPEITQSPGRSSDTSEGSENSGSFEDSGRSDEEFYEDGASSKEGGSETPQVRRYTRESKALWKKAIIEKMVSLEKNQTCSLVRISARKKASQRLWMFKVKEEQNGRKGALNDTSTQHKSEGFQLAGQKENLVCSLKEILYGLIQAPRQCWAKLVRILISEVSLIFVEDSWNEDPCRDVHQREPVQYVWRYRKVRVVALVKGIGFEVYRDYLRRRGVVQPQVNPDSTIARVEQFTPFRVGQVAQPQVNPDSTIAQVEQLMPFRVGQAVQRL